MKTRFLFCAWQIGKFPQKDIAKRDNTPSLTGFHHSPISYPECLHGEITRRVFFVATLSIRSSTNFKSCVSQWTDSNRQSYSYKESALPLCYIGLSVTLQRKEILMKPKKERTPRTTVYGSHFAEYRKLCNDSRRT